VRAPERDSELRARLPQRPRLVAGQSEPKLDDVPLGFGELGDYSMHLLTALSVGHFLDRLRAITGQQIAERGLTLLAHRLIEACQTAADLAKFGDLLD
jgi:hypothetical protein